MVRSSPVRAQETAREWGTPDPPYMTEGVRRAAAVPGNSETPRVEVTSSYGQENDQSEAFPSTQDVLNKIALLYLERTDMSKTEKSNGFVQYMEKVRKALIVDIDTGSLIVTVECSSLKILEGLWKDYTTGYLSRMAQKFLLTQEILKGFGLAEFKLTATIKKGEYTACRELLIAGMFMPFIWSLAVGTLIG